jgi:hypothetical protein
MSAIRLPLLCAFAGGCLSNAILFGLWHAADGAAASSAKEQQRYHHVAELAATAPAAPSVGQPSELAANAVQPAHELAREPAPAPEVDSAGPAPAGSAVSDVLMGLEAAYRERVAARAPAQPASTLERADPPAPADNAAVAVEPVRAIPAPPVAEVIPVAPPVAVAALSERRAVVPAAVAPVAVPAALAPEPAAPPAFTPQEAPPPSQVYYGDINQNTYITNVRQGDVYLIQMQQLAMLQYMQLLGLSGAAAPQRHVGGAAARPTQFPSGITNPDNPWGFHFSPPNLVR